MIRHPDGDPDDSELIRRAQAGDREAFGGIAQRYANRILAFHARSVGDRDDANDLLQETLIRMWKGIATYADSGRLEAWIFTIARRAAADRGRALQRRRRVVLRDMGGEGPATPLQFAEAADLESRISSALAQLPEQRRSVFLMRQHSSMTFDEIARALGIPLGTALSHMRLAVQYLKEKLKHHEP